MPILSLIAGPNGSGKSTLTEWVDLAGRGLLLDADAIAHRMRSSDPRSVAIAAGKEVLTRIGEYIRHKKSFAVETTLSSRSSFRLMRDARSQGYEIRLTFVALDSPERCIDRIRTRVLRGGHSIPDNDVRRRYSRSIANLPEALRVADIAKIYDNSGHEPRLLVTVKSGLEVMTSGELPPWIQSGKFSA